MTRVQLEATADLTEVDVDAALTAVRSVPEMSGWEFSLRCIGLKDASTQEVKNS